MNKIKTLSRVFSKYSIERMKNYPPSFAPIYFIIKKDVLGEVIDSFLSNGISLWWSFLSNGLSLWWSGCIYVNGIYKGMLNE
jgi:hypothetical protein